MALRIISAEERLAQAAEKTSFAIFGPPAIGKTSLLLHLDADSTLALDFEAGMKSVQSWKGRSVAIRTWQDAIDIICLVGGIDPAASEAHAFSAAHHAHVSNLYGNTIDVSDVRTVFADSITHMSRLAMVWAQSQPQSFSDKTGKPDTRGAYGLMGREVVRALQHLQHAAAKTVVFVGGLQSNTDDFGRVTWEPQTEGAKIARELPFIVDQVITFDLFDQADLTNWQHAPGKGEHRAFCCRSPNPWALPAKDRSGQLDLIEEPHLGKLLEKINRPARTVALVNSHQTPKGQ